MGAPEGTCGFWSALSHRVGRPCGGNLAGSPESASDSGVRLGELLTRASDVQRRRRPGGAEVAYPRQAGVQGTALAEFSRTSEALRTPRTSAQVAKLREASGASGNVARRRFRSRHEPVAVRRGWALHLGPPPGLSTWVLHPVVLHLGPSTGSSTWCLIPLGPGGAFWGGTAPSFRMHQFIMYSNT